MPTAALPPPGSPVRAAQVARCRELKGELIDKAMRLEWAYALKREDERTIAGLRKEVAKAWAVADASKEKQVAAQGLIEELRVRTHEISMASSQRLYSHPFALAGGNLSAKGADLRSTAHSLGVPR